MTQEGKSVVRVLVSGLIGIILFLVFLAVLRYFTGVYPNDFFIGVVDFLFANAGLVIFFSILFLIGDIFLAFGFPVNLPGPIFSAFGSVFLVLFVFRFIGFMDAFYALGIYPGLRIAEIILYPLVFVLVIIAGYLSIFHELVDKEKKSGKQPPAGSPTESQGSGNIPASAEKEAKPGDKTWGEVGAEFRQLIYDAFHKAREDIKR